jgi:hypothetical protein
MISEYWITIRCRIGGFGERYLPVKRCAMPNQRKSGGGEPTSQGAASSYGAAATEVRILIEESA